MEIYEHIGKGKYIVIFRILYYCNMVMCYSLNSSIKVKGQKFSVAAVNLLMDLQYKKM